MHQPTNQGRQSNVAATADTTAIARLGCYLARLGFIPGLRAAVSCCDGLVLKEAAPLLLLSYGVLNLAHTFSHRPTVPCTLCGSGASSSSSERQRDPAGQPVSRPARRAGGEAQGRD